MSERPNFSPVQLNTLLAKPEAAPTIQKKQLTGFEKGKITLLYEQGLGYERIACQIGRPKSTIQNFIQRYIERGTYEKKQRLGQQKKTSKSTEDAALALIEGNASTS